MKKRIALLIITELLWTACVFSQDYSTVFAQAEEAYELGHWDTSDSLLLHNLKRMSGEERVKSYRLLALSMLNQDETQKAEEYVTRLLALDPYYTAYGDAPRFVDMVEKLKKGKTTVSTASKMAETIEEVPVPVTLITDRMIEASGARTLSDVIELFVPGISRLSSVEDNVAMRGISGLGQETMLVLLDGHRLNSSSTNIFSFDVRNDLQKIKRIEVLRGPASSLYGNVALTAVVNIITKDGNDLDGGEVTAKVGHNKEYSGTLLLGHGNLKTEYLAWASVYNSTGEKHNLLGTTHYLGGYNNKPTFDAGIKVRWGDLNVSVSSNYCKTVPYYNLIEVNNDFSYDQYHKQNGDKPGVSRQNTRIDLDYSRSMENFTLSVSAFGGKERINMYNVLGDSVPYYLAAALAEKLGIKDVKTRGVWQAINWEDYTFGGTVSGTYKYKLGKNMFGSLMGGVQYEVFTLTDADLKLGADFNKVNNCLNTIFSEGNEHTLSAFVQLKHNFLERLIFNGGLRYDHKIRQDAERLNTYSPRMSLIWLTNDQLSLKACYSHSFVDAPFFYRGSKISILQSGKNLQAEKMNSVQIGAIMNWSKIHLKAEMNCFYNNVTELVYYNSGTSDTFVNSGKVNMGGVEGCLWYNTDNTFANINFTVQHPFDVENYYTTTQHEIINIPKFLLNITASQRLFNSSRYGALSVRANMHYQSEMECLRNDLMIKIVDPVNIYTQHQNDYAVFGGGIEWKSLFGLRASLDAHNIFNHKYYIGGQLKDPVPGMGFNLQGKISYCF